MSAGQSNLIFRDKLKADIQDLLNTSDRAHKNISNSFEEVSFLYNKSSVLEDIVLTDYLSIQNTLKSININNTLNKTLIIESFTSQDYLDVEFPVDKRLNLDIHNGDLTLPIESTRDLAVSDIIFGQESNGSIGNSLEGGINSSVKAILTKDSTTMFEYELISSVFSSPKLDLTLTLRLNKEEIANGVFLRTFAQDGVRYPTLEYVGVSKDGEKWIYIDNILDTNKPDHYIRFMPQEARFIKVKFSQTVSTLIETSFGKKNRYLIGIREITVKQTRYASVGEYVSKPFTQNKGIGSVIFNYEDRSNGDIRYFASADNGSTWISLPKNKPLEMINQELGIRGQFDVNSLRVKVKINREELPYTKKQIEYILFNDTSKYYTSKIPSKSSQLLAYVGNHISCGEFKQYFINSMTPEEALTANVKERGLFESPSCIFDKKNLSFMLSYIPYYKGIENDLTIKINDSRVKNDRTIWAVIPHENKLHSMLVFSQSALQNDSLNGSISVSYKPYVHNHRDVRSPIVTLPPTRPLFITSADGVSINSVALQRFLNDTLAEKYVSDGNPDFLFDGDLNTVFVASNKDIVELDAWIIKVKFDQDTIDSFEPVKSYFITPSKDEDYDLKLNPKKWELLGSLDGEEWKVLDKQDLEDDFWEDLETKEFRCDNDCIFEYYKLKVYDNFSAEEDLDIVKYRLAIRELSLQYEKKNPLDNKADFKIIDRYTIKIEEENYSPNWDYIVSYLPCVDINEFLPEDIQKNEIALQSMHKSQPGTKICFEYYYQDSEVSNIKPFYTPICNEYRMILL